GPEAPGAGSDATGAAWAAGVTPAARRAESREIGRDSAWHGWSYHCEPEKRELAARALFIDSLTSSMKANT
ncbi:hypothetical protein LZB61_09100, partial [Campylobacter jejuni]